MMLSLKIKHVLGIAVFKMAVHKAAKPISVFSMVITMLLLKIMYQYLCFGVKVFAGTKLTNETFIASKMAAKTADKSFIEFLDLENIGTASRYHDFLLFQYIRIVEVA